MKRVTVIGGEGFVGSAFAAHLARRTDIELVAVTRGNYGGFAGRTSDVTIEAACNSRKFLAEEEPVPEFDLSVRHRLRTLHDFPAKLHVHVSSVDVYRDLTSPQTTREDSADNVGSGSNYGFHKLLAEELVEHYADRWLIVRLAGMVGTRLRKNPVYDIVHGQPLRIHPDSQYQFMGTDEVARIVWELVEEGIDGEVFNVCGEGLVAPRQIAELAGRDMNLSLLDDAERPRVVDINLEKLRKRKVIASSMSSIVRFLRDQGLRAGRGE